jgi:murein DD-endopeptidase MepM/ murein hydrolase activator NlpD
MKRISFFVLSNTGSRASQISVPISLVYVSVAMGFVVLAVLGYLAHDYYQLRTVGLVNQAYESQIGDQKEIITGQHAQIQAFTSEINKLKSKLVTLNNFEKKIRVIANLDQENDQESLFGVGGSIPEDLATDVDLTKRQTGLLREMHDQVDDLYLATSNQKTGFSSLLEALEGQRNLLACTPAIRPVKGWMTSQFGYRNSPFTGRKELHKGLDIANREGTQIIAPADGIVKSAGRKGLLGKAMDIDHGHGMVTRYGHLKEILKKRGETVKRGDIIAEMGDSGRSTGPHLHYEVHLNGVPVNPVKYILN